MPKDRREAMARVTKPPNETPAEEAAREESERRANSLQRQPTFQNEKKSKLQLEGLGLSDFTRNPEFGRAKLLEALQTNDHEWVHLLVFEAEKKSLGWIHDGWYGQSPWITACMHGSTRSLKEMLKFRSVDKIKTTSAGQSPLFQAVNCDQLETVQWLVERRDVEGKELTNMPVYDLEQSTVDGRTPLWQAAYKGYKPICEYLISKGANVLRLSNPARQSHMAAKRFKADDVAHLLPHLDRVKIISIGNGHDLHRIHEGDAVEARYGGGKKFYPATVTKVHDNHTYDLLYKDGGVETSIEKKMVHKIVNEADLGEEAEEAEIKEVLQIEAPPPAAEATSDSTSTALVPVPPVTPKNGPKKARVRFVHDGKEIDTTTDKLKATPWLGTLPSEAAKGQGHGELYSWLLGREDDVRKKAKMKLKAVGKMTIGLLAGRDESKYEGML